MPQPPRVRGGLECFCRTAKHDLKFSLVPLNPRNPRNPKHHRSLFGEGAGLSSQPPGLQDIWKRSHYTVEGAEHRAVVGPPARGLGLGPVSTRTAAATFCMWASRETLNLRTEEELGWSQDPKPQWPHILLLLC